MHYGNLVLRVAFVTTPAPAVRSSLALLARHAPRCPVCRARGRWSREGAGGRRHRGVGAPEVRELVSIQQRQLRKGYVLWLRLVCGHAVASSVACRG